MKTIEQLTKDGWKPVADFAGCILYGKGINRKVYDPKKDEVILDYTLHEAYLAGLKKRNEQPTQLSA